MNRFFEKISYDQFEKDVSESIDLYNSYKTPCRHTKCSAGYDFFAIEDILIKSNQIVKIPTGIKAKCLSNEFLLLAVRSSMGFKNNLRLCNQVGIIDSDYYNNISNEGHIWVSLQNHGEDDILIKKGEGFIQGIFIPYFLCDNDNYLEDRSGWSVKEIDLRDEK